jgi:hypothetical protein
MMRAWRKRRWVGERDAGDSYLYVCLCVCVWVRGCDPPPHTPHTQTTNTAQASILDPSKPLPSTLPALLTRTLSAPWPPKAEFFALSLLRPLLLRPAFVTSELLAVLVGRVAAPEVRERVRRLMV